MAERDLTDDPYATPKPPRDHAALMVRTAVIAVVAGGLAFTGYLMSNTATQEQQVASLQPAEMQQAAYQPAAPAPTASVEDAAPAGLATRTIARSVVPPPQETPAEPMIANTPPALPPGADPAVAIPEIQPSSPAG